MRLADRFAVRMGGMPRSPAADRGRLELTRFGSGLLAATVLVFVLSVRSGAAGLQPLAALLAAPLLLAVGRALRPKSFRWVVQLGTEPTQLEVPVGTTLTPPVTITNAGRGSLPRLQLDIGRPGALTGAPLVVQGLAPGERRSVDVALTGERRGLHTGLGVVIVDEGMFGVLRATQRFEIGRGSLDIAVVPTTVPLAAPPQGRGRGDDDDPLATGPAALQGFLPRGTRDFRPGDEPRSVHWRATARTGRLTVREWDPPAATGVALVVQLAPDSAAPVLPERPLGSGAAADERLLEVAASAGLAALRAGRRLALVQASVTVVAGPHGPVGEVAEVDVRTGLDPTGLLRGLAAVETVRTGLVPLAQAAVEAAGRGGTVVLLLGIGWGHWEPGELVEVARLVHGAGTTLEVVYGRTPDGPLPMGAAAAFAALAALAPLRAGEALRDLDTARPWPAPQPTLVPA